ncbi:sigma-70 family RNA polymerase sigma factor [Robiginitalea marina]|uniref:Sigma-70 family RNA polymerase sigma factor n=1 Tax=Robiginitalea marina TaxID=2954105 RepID=A0ABT1AUD0_9FLAO|nr:sigma-70 family RNA polymerase sigma factor [Robiginitalea marina]MCO5723631.1 sigma-70 family RNA polymerase sigma factor [Robiginitalea marina]
MELHVDDASLVKNYLNGDEKALECLIARHNQRIFNFIYSKVFDTEITEDLFQETFIKVIRTLKLGKYNEEGKFLPWVMRIAHNLVMDHYRKNNRMPRYEGSEQFHVFAILEDDGVNAEKRLIRDQIESDLGVLVDRLPGEQREVVRMRMYQNMSFKEIAERTGVSINTALGRMRYALINLRKFIEENQIVLTD